MEKLSNFELTKIMADIGQSTKDNLPTVGVETDALRSLVEEFMEYRRIRDAFNDIQDGRVRHKKLIQKMRGIL